MSSFREMWKTSLTGQLTHPCLSREESDAFLEMCRGCGEDPLKYEEGHVHIKNAIYGFWCEAQQAAFGTPIPKNVQIVTERAALGLHRVHAARQRARTGGGEK